MSDKPLPPTPKRIRDAREEGQVPYSKDAVSLLVVGLVFELLFAAADFWKTRLGGLMEGAVRRIGQPFHKGLELGAHDAILVFATLSGTVLAVAVLAGLVATWATIGVAYAPKKFSKGFERMNPGNFFQNIFSPNLLIELALSLAKALVIGAVVFFFIRHEIARLPFLATGTLELAWDTLLAMVKGVVRGVLGALVLFAVLDIRLRQMLLMKQLRMDHSEVKREYKDMMGDPMVKSRRRMLAMELLHSPPPRPQHQANALVVNPEHFAVALFYEEGQVPLPVVVAKGLDDDALAMIAEARSQDIPVIRFRRLARSLHAAGKEGESIPRQAFRAVALIYRLIEEVRAEGVSPDDLAEIDDDSLLDPAPAEEPA